MGYTLTPFAVDLARVRSAVGSGDRDLLNSLVRKFAEQFEEIDGLDEDFDEDSDDLSEWPDSAEGAERFTAGLRDSFAPLLEAVQHPPGPVPADSPARPESARDAVEPIENETDAATSDPDDEPALDGLPDELNTSEKLGASVMDAFTRLLRGEELDSDHPIARVLAEEADGLDEEDERASGPSAPHPSMREVIRQLIMGEPYDERVGFKYGYAVESLCSHFGEPLPNEHWCSFRSGTSSGWFRKIDGALKSLGLAETTFRVATHLANRGSPIPIPEIADSPAIGYLTSAEVRAAAQALGAADLTAVRPADVRASLAELQAWLQSCSESGRDLVCFYY